MRTKSATVNSLTAIIQKMIETILSFIYRSIFIKFLGMTYLGVNGLFTNIFSIMSLAELGIGSSIIFLLYKPLYEKDEKRVSQLMMLFAKTYKIIATVILIFGLMVIPLFPTFINAEDLQIPNLVFIYILLLLNTASSYIFSYKRSLLEADQKAYISTINLSIFSIINTSVRILLILITKSYILTLVVSILITLISNIFISVKVNKLYPYLTKTKEKLDKLTLKEISKRMKAIMMHKIGNIVITSTDNIVISKYINLISVGIYSNYTMITNIIYSTFSTIFVSITSSVGNLKVSGDNEKSEPIFNKLLFLNYAMYFFTFVFLMNIFNDFIYVWIGNDYLFSKLTVFLIVICLYISGMRHIPVTFINSSGLNLNTRYKAILEAVVNLVVSIVLAQTLGINGVIIGTIVCYLVGSVWIEPVVLYKRWFNKKPTSYFIKYVSYLLFAIVSSFGIGFLLSKLSVNSWGLLFLKSFIVMIISILLFVIMFFKTEEFKYFKDISLDFLKKAKNKIIKK